MRLGLTGLIPYALMAQTAPELFFEERVRPVLAEHCYSCHGTSATADLRVDSREALLRGGRSGPAIVVGHAEESLLVQAVSHRHAKLKMPPAGKLAQPQIDALRQWVADGAVWPVRAVASTGKPAIKGLAPIARPSGSIDTWVKGTPGAEVSREALIRRVSFDLTGLPPAYEEVRAFLTDASAGAYATLVDRLLASPQFGERWGRYWLDIARYAEDDVRGLGQAAYPNAFRYRDWVIAAFNEDLRYDEFIRLQIAADLVPRAGKDDRAALGLFGLGPWYYSNAPPPESRADERHDRVDVLTRGFLGLTVACARCHDHKFDPISTAEYYGLAGVFARTQYAEYPLAPREEVERWDEKKKKLEETEAALKEYVSEQGKQLAEILAGDTARYLMALQDPGERPNFKKLAKRHRLDAVTLERWAKYLAKPQQEHSFLAEWKKQPGAEAAARFQDAVFAVLKEKKEVDADNEAAVAPTRPKRNAPKTQLPNGFATYDEFCPGCGVVARSLERDRFMFWSDLFKPADKRGGGGILFYGSEEIERFLEGPWKANVERLRAEAARLKTELATQYPFVHGIAERPGAAPLRIHMRGNAYNLGEVAPQRFLQACGGQALDEGSGRRQLAEAVSRSPLAARVAVNRMWGWLTGRFLSGTPSNFGALGERPSNPELLEYLAARFVDSGYSVKGLVREIVLSEAYQKGALRRRLDAEAVRDAMLKVSGLWAENVGGPSVDLAKDRSRRSVYGKVSRFRLEESLVLFDFPNPSITSEKRNVTHVPQQQLFLLNSPFVADIAARIAAKTKSVETAYRMVLGRDATAAELSLAGKFLEASDFPAFVQVLLSSNEFHFVD